MKLNDEQKRDAYAILHGVPANRMTPSLGEIFRILLGLGWSLDKAVKKAMVDGAQ